MRRLCAGDEVEVRSLEEILATLDADGTLDGMPFMPEMAKYCGKRLRVEKRAHKTCNTVDNTGGASIRSAVHLEGARCDGSGHGGCQAFCLMFWKEAWLKPGSRPRGRSDVAATSTATLPPEWSCRTVQHNGESRLRYRCQVTDIPRFTTRLQWWDLRQYGEDITSGNVSFARLLRGTSYSLFRMYMRHGVGYRVLRALFDWVQRLRGGSSFPFVTGTLKKTPHHELDLQPGEWVRVKGFDSILSTLNTRCKNRGLGFDTSEMRLHCGKTFRVKRRIQRIIDERTGEMMHFSNPCITLEGVYCTGETTQTRLFCPRAITPYWREIWLERTAAPETARSAREKIKDDPRLGSASHRPDRQGSTRPTCAK